jgi:hypothetical protein
VIVDLETGRIAGCTLSLGWDRNMDVSADNPSANRLASHTKGANPGDAYPLRHAP